MRLLATLALAAFLLPLHRQRPGRPTATNPIPNSSAPWPKQRNLPASTQFIFAIDAYKKANKIAGGNDVKCLDEIFTIQMTIGNYKDAANTASALEAIATNSIRQSPTPKAAAASLSSSTGRRKG